MIVLDQVGKFKKAYDYFKKIRKNVELKKFNKYGEQGVAALNEYTPKNTGLTANSWYYEIVDVKGVIKVQFKNKNIQNGVNIAIILQYGHGTNYGGWVVGLDYINPALAPIFKQMAADMKKEVDK